MKEFVTSWIILIGIIILFAVNSYNVKKITTDIRADIKTVQQAVEKENIEEAEQMISKINEIWKKETKKIIYIFPHSQIEEIGRIMILAKEHIKAKDLNDAALRLKEIEYLIKILEKREKITLDNIF